jgi:hypothetical protein
MYLSASGGMPPRVDTALHRAVGDAMARQTLALLKPGGQIIVIARDTKAFECPATDCQVDEFVKRLHKAGAPITQIRRAQLDPLRIVAVAPGDYFELLRKLPEGGVVVSFMGPPLLSDTQSRRLSGAGPSVVALCSLSDRAGLPQLFERKLLHAAIVPKPDAQSGARALFDQYYVEVTAANAASALPSPGGSVNGKSVK